MISYGWVCFRGTWKESRGFSGDILRMKSRDFAFKLNDIYWENVVTGADRLRFLRHKERKFGRGCIEQWRAHQKSMVTALSGKTGAL